MLMTWLVFLGKESQISSECEDTECLVPGSDVNPVISMDISNNGLHDLTALGQAEQCLLDRFQHLTNLDVSKNKLRNFPQRLMEVSVVDLYLMMKVYPSASSSWPGAVWAFHWDRRGQLLQVDTYCPSVTCLGNS